MAAPNAFAAALEKWIFEKATPSIFFIQILPNMDHRDEIIALQKAAATIPLEQRDQVHKDGSCGTGFVVQASASHFKILTSAHIIDHVFKRSMPLSVDDANKLFHTTVLCDHYESSFRRPGQNTHTKRVYGDANILGLDCEKDMMLIEVSRAEVRDLASRCEYKHPPLVCSLIRPAAFEECVMISWPPKRHRSSAKGRISHPSRTMDESGLANPAGHRMNVMQVQLESEFGSSGAPLLNGSCKVIGMLHGGFGRSFSYFVALDEIVTFLAQHGINRIPI